MTTTDFLRKTFQGKNVDMYCSNDGWVCGKIKACTDEIVTLIGTNGLQHVRVDNILSVTHAQNI